MDELIFEVRYPGITEKQCTVTVKLKDWEYYLTDNLGSIRTTVDGSGMNTGSVSSWDDYYPNGLPMPDRSFNYNNPQALNKFTGHEHDVQNSINLTYAGARYLDPEIGQWLSVDPLADQFPAWSPYNYTMGNPLRLVDPDGMAAIDPDKLKKAGDQGLAYAKNPTAYVRDQSLTYCNVATGYATKKALGYDLLADPNSTTGYPKASTMLDMMNEQKDVFKSVDLADVQSIANEGGIVFGVTTDHIVMGVPGEEIESGDWTAAGINNGKAPMVMDGGDKPGIKSANYSWGVGKVKDVQWFQVRETYYEPKTDDLIIEGQGQGQRVTILINGE